MKRLFKEGLGYGVASAAALMVDMLLLWLLVQFAAVAPLNASVAAFLGGATVAYVLSVRLAFRRHRLANRGAEFLSFVALGTVGLAVNWVVMAIAVRTFAVHYLLAKCIAAIFTFATNFFLRRQTLFVNRPGGRVLPYDHSG